MEKQGSATFILSGAIPRELTDILAIVIIGLTGLQAYQVRFSLAGLELGPLMLLLTLAATCGLASLSNTVQRLREELALLAYGGSMRQVWLRHFLRGFVCCLIALSPLIATDIIGSGYVLHFRPILFLGAALLGGFSYSGPSFRRVRSVDFAEHYKA